ncbi:hypothetical protein ACP70R_032152 [Stipagrostis hirtigluma subsp. patula]
MAWHKTTTMLLHFLLLLPLMMLSSTVSAARLLGEDISPPPGFHNPGDPIIVPSPSPAPVPLAGSISGPVRFHDPIIIDSPAPAPSPATAVAAKLWLPRNVVALEHPTGWSRPPFKDPINAPEPPDGRHG